MRGGANRCIVPTSRKVSVSQLPEQAGDGGVGSPAYLRIDQAKYVTSQVYWDYPQIADEFPAAIADRKTLLLANDLLLGFVGAVLRQNVG